MENNKCNIPKDQLAKIGLAEPEINFTNPLVVILGSTIAIIARAVLWPLGIITRNVDNLWTKANINNIEHLMSWHTDMGETILADCLKNQTCSKRVFIHYFNHYDKIDEDYLDVIELYLRSNNIITKYSHYNHDSIISNLLNKIGYVPSNVFETDNIK